MVSPGKILAAPERFTSKICVDLATGCHEWTGALTGLPKHRYGSFYCDQRKKPVAAHRWAYEQAKGPIPEGFHLDHLCRNTKCVNPDHLEAVAPKENHQRAHWPIKTQCKRGHELTPNNVYQKPNGGHRQCRKCRAITNSDHYVRHSREPRFEPGLLSVFG